MKTVYEMKTVYGSETVRRNVINYYRFKDDSVAIADVVSNCTFEDDSVAIADVASDCTFLNNAKGDKMNMRYENCIFKGTFNPPSTSNQRVKIDKVERIQIGNTYHNQNIPTSQRKNRPQVIIGKVGNVSSGDTVINSILNNPENNDLRHPQQAARNNDTWTSYKAEMKKTINAESNDLKPSTPQKKNCCTIS